MAATLPKPQVFLACSRARSDYGFVEGSVRPALTRPQNRPWATARDTATLEFRLHHVCSSTINFSLHSHFKSAKNPEHSPGHKSPNIKIKTHTHTHKHKLPSQTLCKIKTDSVPTSCLEKLTCQQHFHLQKDFFLMSRSTGFFPP